MHIFIVVTAVYERLPSSSEHERVLRGKLIEPFRLFLPHHGYSKFNYICIIGA